MSQKCLILANGDYPLKGNLSYLNKLGYSTLFCADGGANTAYKMGLHPNYIVGDFDSISKETLDHFRNDCKIIHITRQDDTDVEKCIKLAIKLKYQEAILLGATGDRLDHSFCNIGILLKFRDKINLKLLHHNSIMETAENKIMLHTVTNEIISIYGISDKTIITSTGLKYPLSKKRLPFGEKESTSNVANSDKVELLIKNGVILIVRDFKKMKKYGLFK
jgi:thiamine pyrophosphokinase